MSDDSASPAPRRRFRPRSFGSIQSKLLVMLLLSSILSAAVVGFFAYRTGTNALREEAFERLTELRQERTRAIQDYAARQKSSAIINSRGVAIDALKAFDPAYAELRGETITAAQKSKVEGYYENTFIPQLQKFSDGTVQADSFTPTLPARLYLHATYTAASDDFDEKLQIDDAGDGSAWSRANKKYQPFFREVINGSGADDIMLLNLDGDIVYTAYKGVDLGSNIKRGEYRGGGLEKVFDEAVRSNSRDFVAVSDFELYQPSYNLAAGFVASPIADGDEIIGVYVSQLPISGINGIMTGDAREDVVTGLGETGETYLGGPDDLMRSNSRELIENRKEYAEHAIDRGTSREAVDRALEANSTVMLQPLRSVAQQRARDGKSGTIITTDYLGHEVLDSYGPANIEGLDWTVIAKMNTSEAFAPVNDFARNILLATAAMVLLISAASVFMARVFTTPLNKLLTGVRAVAGGELGAQVDAGSRDEFGDLGTAFNDMSGSLAAKQALLTAQQDENERILGGLMPEPVVKRYRGGETDISDEHQNVTVVFTEVEGFDAFADRLPAAEALELLNSISRGFDEAAAKAGIEKVRSVGTTYVASSGLVVQRVDHIRRAVDFALEVAAMAERFNSQHGASLVMRAGVHTGDVRSGLVGRSDVVYNLWGDAVNLAYRLRTAAGDAGIYVTDEVKDRLGAAYVFEQAGTVEDRPVWRVVPGGKAS
ncbi:MAG: adenylate/guanylate cyclase domain-containing protein [Solirubrobacterales bacterium]